MTGEALLPIVRGFFVVVDLDMRIVAGEAREFIAADAFTFALPETFEVPDDFEFLFVRSGPDEGDDVIG